MQQISKEVKSRGRGRDAVICVNRPKHLLFNITHFFQNWRTQVKCIRIDLFCKPAKLGAAGCGQLRPDSEWFVDNSFMFEGLISPPCCCSELGEEWDYRCSPHVAKDERPCFYFSDWGSGNTMGGQIYHSIFYHSSDRHNHLCAQT